MKSVSTVLRIFAGIISLSVLTSCALVQTHLITGDLPTSTENPTYIPPQKVSPVTATPYTAPSFQTPEQELYGLANQDGQGAIFMISTVEGTVENPIFPTSDAPYYASAMERLTTIQTVYNLQITEEVTTVEDLVKRLQKNIVNDTYTTDLILIPAEYVSAFEGKNFLVDPSRVALLDNDAEYFRKDIAELYSSYAVYGDALQNPDEQLCIFYNCQLAESLGIHNLCSTVTSGQWTWDLLADYAQKGKIASELPLEYPFAIAFGVQYYDLIGQDKELNDLPSDIAPKADELIGQMIGDNRICENAKERFIAGDALFYIGPISDCQNLTQMSDAWSLLPLPAATEGGEYPCLRDYHIPDYVFLIPRFAYASERSAQIISALCAIGDNAKQAAYTQYLPYLRINEAQILLGTILTGE